MNSTTQALEAMLAAFVPDSSPVSTEAQQRAAAMARSALSQRTDPWRQAVDEALIAHALDCTGPGDDPKEKVKELIEWAVTIATDPRVAEQAGVVIDAYALPPKRPLDSGVKIQRARQLEGPDLWAVRYSSDCLNKSGEWEWEPMPSSRGDAFLARCRFATADEAIRAALAADKKGETDHACVKPGCQLPRLSGDPYCTIHSVLQQQAAQKGEV
jgi:hypothetical protein